LSTDFHSLSPELLLEGRYRLRTIVPARYPGRTPHIHVKIQARDQPVLTTQLYFPGEPGNAADRLFRKELLMRATMAGAGLAGRFDFVLDLA
jgi:protocatechuate 3,4-dioxygenase beta subunit